MDVRTEQTGDRQSQASCLHRRSVEPRHGGRRFQTSDSVSSTNISSRSCRFPQNSRRYHASFHDVAPLSVRILRHPGQVKGVPWQSLGSSGGRNFSSVFVFYRQHFGSEAHFDSPALAIRLTVPFSPASPRFFCR